MNALSNASWVAAIQASKIAIQLASLAILSRILSPSDFGAMAIATVAINFSLIIRDLGTAATIIHNKEISDRTLNSLFLLNSIAGAVLGIILYLSSSWISQYFSFPQLESMLAILGMAFPIGAFTVVHQALIEKRSGFRTLARIEVVAGALGLFAGVTSALYNFGALSLAIQAFATTSAISIQLLIQSSWKPSLRFSLKEVKKHRRYSGSFTIFSLVNFFSRNADSAIIGRELGALSLGIYSQAYKLMMIPLQLLNAVSNRALFPVLANRQFDLPAVRALYLRALSILLLLSAPICSGLWITRDMLVQVVLGTQWEAASSVLLFLAPVGYIQSLTSSTGPIFMATGTTDIQLKLGLFGAALMILAFFTGVNWGIEGVAACYLIANLVNLFPCMTQTLKQIEGTWNELILAATPPTLSAAGMATALYFLQPKIFEALENTTMTLLATIAAGFIIYTGILILCFNKYMRTTLLASYKKNYAQ